MSTIIFDAVVVYDKDEPLYILYGQNSELLRTLKKSKDWELMIEELSENDVDPNTILDINQLEELHDNGKYDYDIKIKVYRNQSYSKPNTKKLKY